MTRFDLCRVGATVLLGCVVWFEATRPALAQAPTAEPFANPPAAPAAANPPVPVPTVPPIPSSSREAQLEERVRQLEATVQRLANQMQATPGAASTADAPAADSAGSDDETAGGPAPRGTAAPDVGTPAETLAPSGMGGPAAPGQSNPPNPPPTARFNSPATLDNIRANTKFGPGF